jgi:hypothetical protein
MPARSRALRLSYVSNAGAGGAGDAAHDLAGSRQRRRLRHAIEPQPGLARQAGGAGETLQRQPLPGPQADQPGIGRNQDVGWPLPGAAGQSGQDQRHPHQHLALDDGDVLEDHVCVVHQHGREDHRRADGEHQHAGRGDVFGQLGALVELLNGQIDQLLERGVEHLGEEDQQHAEDENGLLGQAEGHRAAHHAHQQRRDDVHAHVALVNDGVDQAAPREADRAHKGGGLGLRREGGPGHQGLR